ncbi:hypothetical protein [Paenibacillus xylanilyticus]|uniref:SprT-like domain-containing protein n=1 Tax=Paenibacillus xylanilyticus TaxID=248903 RepID=A0A7Y6EUE3_9BACL|nr:hypothetical protein [Paenibacillus xylanilyticus]NUU74604.1 hypothetical protein [Paenibacillus xylanilyticus]
MKIPKLKYPELYQWITEFKEKTKFKRKINLKYTNGKGVLGRVTVFGNIELEKGFIKHFMSLQPNVVKFILAHEFIHIFQEELVSLHQILNSKSHRSVVLRHEMRANINGAALTGLTNEEIREAQIQLWLYEGHKRKQLNYKSGYPSRMQIIKFVSKYNRYSDDVGYELLNDYYEVSGEVPSGQIKSIKPTKFF